MRLREGDIFSRTRGPGHPSVPNTNPGLSRCLPQPRFPQRLCLCPGARPPAAVAGLGPWRALSVKVTWRSETGKADGDRWGSPPSAVAKSPCAANRLILQSLTDGKDLTGFSAAPLPFLHVLPTPALACSGLNGHWDKVRNQSF